MITFTAYDVAGNPLTGLASTMAWAEYLNATTGAPISPQPGFSELGSGMYEVDAAPFATGIVNLGTSCSPQFILLGPITTTVVAAFSLATQAPLTGLTPSWDCIFDVTTGLPIGSPPSITEYPSTGMYAIPGLTSVMAGRVDFGDTAAPQYVDVGLTPTGAGPVIGTPTPPPGTYISQAQIITIPISDEGLTPSNLTIEIVVVYSNGVVELAYSPLLGWSPAYSISSIPSALPGNITLRRLGGWPLAPTASMSVVDDSGASASASWSWFMKSIASPATITTQAPIGSTNYGSDCRTYLDLGNGPDLDPNLTIITDARIVMCENILRRLLNGPGSFFYAPTVGLDLRQFINKANTALGIATIQQQIQSEVLRDQRISSATVTVLLSGGSLSATIQGFGAPGPFTIVLTVSALTVSYTFQ